MNLREAFKYTIPHFRAGNAVQWISQPGVGKTDYIQEFVAWIKKNYAGKRVGLGISFMATQSPIGFTGLPWKGVLEYMNRTYTITDPAVPQWFLALNVDTGEVAPADTFDIVLMVIEEWGQGDLDTKRAAADLLLHGACGKWKLPPGSFRLALSNSDARDGVTKEFDFVINRRAQMNIRGDVVVWVEDFANKPQHDGMLIMPVTKVWAMNNSNILFEDKPKEQGPWSTPRSVTMWDRWAQYVMEDNGGSLPIDEPGFIEGTHGTVGAAAGESILSTCRFQLELPQYESVVTDPMGTEIPKRMDLLMLMMYELAARVRPDDVGSVLQYVGRVKASDMHVTFVTAMLRRDYKNMIDTPPMKAWISKNAAMVARIGTLITRQ